MKTVRTEIRDTIFQSLADDGLTVETIRTGNGYFIFDLGENAVTIFKINGIKRWTFGMWITDTKTESGDPAYMIELFGQHDDLIDKFKPNRSPVIETMNAFTGFTSDWDPDKRKEDLFFITRAFKDHVWLIKRNPSFALAKYYYEVWDDKSESLPQWMFSHWWYYRISKPVRIWLTDKINMLWGEMICRLVNIIDGKRAHATFADKNKSNHDGWKMSPGKELVVLHKSQDDDIMYKIWRRWFGRRGRTGINWSTGDWIQVTHMWNDTETGKVEPFTFRQNVNYVSVPNSKNSDE